MKLILLLVVAFAFLVVLCLCAVSSKASRLEEERLTLFDGHRTIEGKENKTMFKFIGNPKLITQFFGPMTLPGGANKALVSNNKSISEGFTGLVNTVQEANIPSEAKEYAIGKLYEAKLAVEGTVQHGWTEKGY